MAAAPFVLGVVALYNWVISPHVGYLHAMRRLEPVVSQMAGELGAVCGTLDEKLATMRGMREELEDIRAGLFTREQSRTFIHDLHALIEGAGCTMMSTCVTCDQNPKRTEDPNVPLMVETHHADVTVEGQYEQVVALLGALREKRQKVWVDSCRMDLLDPRTKRLKCQFGLTIHALLPPGEFGQ